MSLDEYKVELGDIKQNVRNLGQCLQSVLNRIEELETKTPEVPMMVDDDDPNTKKHVQVEESEDVEEDGTRVKRVHVTERVVTTKTFQTLQSPVCEFKALPTLDQLKSELEMPKPKPGPQVVGYRKKKHDDHVGAEFDIRDGQVVVSKLNNDSNLRKAGILHVNDVVLEVNGTEVKSAEQLNNLWKKSADHCTFKIVPAAVHPPNADAKFVRAMFDYDPAADADLPVREIGLTFKTGDVLHVLSYDDDKYWQARKVNDLSRVGLIPSKKLADSRRGSGDEKSKLTSFIKRRKTNGDANADSAYEEVGKLSPYGRRTLVLLGAPGVGRRTLKSMLLAHDASNFATVTPYTSRTARDGEVDGREYHFIKKDGMQKDIERGGYVEWGEYNANLYGTTVQSVRDITRQGRICVLDCSPQAAKYLHTKEFMPYIVFIAPPTLDELKQLYQVHPNRTKSKTDDDLRRTCEESAKLETQYRSLVDLVLVNRNVDVTFRRLMDALEALKTEPQWVPSNWLQ